MPIYEYSCRQCEHAFEAFVDDESGVECPKCHARNLDRLLSLPARPVQSVNGATCSADSSVPPCGPACGRWAG